jgi:outer membrane protein OmpU
VTTSDPSALYEYSTGDLTLYASVTQPSDTDADAYSIAAKYALGDYTVALGYERESVAGGDVDHIVLGATATFGAATVKAIYGQASANPGTFSESQWAVSVDYKVDALTVTAFYANDEDLFGSEGYGLGASYDLGGGASVVGGYARNQTTGLDAYDLGVSMSF